ncbi:MAG: sugar phosphate isomerase/epimerase [Spirochaetia bacterium]|jgi:sugar phosphate isomerase/epimerase|nr:sugar phosphate isomerase/epimerase [Spirochaetia bacterium]
MEFSVCAYPETALDLLNNTPADVALELQSFGLKGVKSSEAWNERASFFSDFASSHRDRRFHLHGPFLDLPWWSYDHLIIEVVERRLSDTVVLCETILPEHLVMHLNCPSYFCRADRAQRWTEHALEFLRPHLVRLDEMGVLMVLENTYEPDAAAALAFSKAAEAEGLAASICLDVGHAHTFSPTPPETWVSDLGSRIAHYHIHDNDQSDDQHHAPSKGTIDFPSLLSAITRNSPEATLSMEIEADSAEILRGLDYIRNLSR